MKGTKCFLVLDKHKTEIQKQKDISKRSNVELSDIKEKHDIEKDEIGRFFKILILL